MNCCFSDLRSKEVINISTGQRLGYICDMEIDITDGKILSLIVPGDRKMGGLVPGDRDYLIPWQGVARMGKDIILVNADQICRPPQKERKIPFLE